MKLCLVTHSFAKGSGQGRVNYEIVQEAIRQGHSITLLSSEVAPELQQHPQVDWVTLSVAKWPTELAKNMAFSVQSKRWVQQHRTEFDLVKVNGAITSTHADVNAVHFVHSSWLRSPAHTFRVRQDLYGVYQGLYTAVNAHWEKQAFQRAKVVVAVSEKIASELIDIGVPSERIRVIVNGVDLQEFTPGTAERTSLQLPEAVPLALFAGDIQTSRKNLDTILRALVHAPDLHLAIAGRTEGSPYPKMAQQLGVAQRTHFLGYRRDIPALMQASDFFVFPSRYEACTLVLLEAMASGLPVITAATAGGAELVTPESGMILSDPNDVQSLAKALNALSSDSGRRQHMSQSARINAERHGWTSMAKQYVELFQELVNERN